MRAPIIFALGLCGCAARPGIELLNGFGTTNRYSARSADTWAYVEQRAGSPQCVRAVGEWRTGETFGWGTEAELIWLDDPARGPDALQRLGTGSHLRGTWRLAVGDDIDLEIRGGLGTHYVLRSPGLGDLTLSRRAGVALFFHQRWPLSVIMEFQDVLLWPAQTLFSETHLESPQHTGLSTLLIGIGFHLTTAEETQ